MTTEERIRRIRLIEEMKRNKETAERLGLVDVSSIKSEPGKADNDGCYSMK